jgi:uncharacterized protein (TIGR02466 family)
MPDIIPIFPTTLYKEKCSLTLTNEEMSVLSKFSGVASSLGNIQSDYSTVLENPALIRLKTEIQKHLDFYFRNIMKISETSDIYITDSWINYTTKNSEHRMHTHTNSILSAVYFLKVKDSVPFLTFTKKDPYFPLDFASTEYNMYNSSEWNLEVTDGDIVVFPSNVWHHVKTNLSDTPRVTLALNSFVKGSVGNANTGTDIHIK